MSPANVPIGLRIAADAWGPHDMALQGNIDSFSVVDVLRLLGSSGKTGRLIVEGDDAVGSLWLVDGSLGGASLARDGAAPTPADPAEVLFDIMRFAEGSFLFEADLRDDGATGEGAGPLHVDEVVDAATAAMEEWTSITDVVASPRAALVLADDLPTPTVEIDRAGWRAIAAIAGGGSTCDEIAVAFGWSELAAMRLVRDLVTSGLVVVGDELPQRFIAPTITGDGFADPFAPAAFEPEAPYAPVPPEPSFGGPAPFDHGQLLRGATEAAPDAPDAAVPPPIGHLAGSEPVPTVPTVPATPTPDAVAPSTASSDAGSGDGRSELFAIFGSVDPFAADRPAADPSGDATAASDDDDLARQLAMLSPRAAEAVASAESGGSLEDAERARVARFLGSV